MYVNFWSFILVNNCSFAVELKPPTNKSSLKSGKSKAKNRMSSAKEELSENKIPFATLQICLHSPITNPCQEINANSYQQPKINKFCQQPTILPKTNQFSLRSNCEYNYKSFDDLILEIMDYIVKNNIETIDDDKEFFCHQVGNMNNKIMKLLACDFNIKTPTKTNIEFTVSLLWPVYRTQKNYLFSKILYEKN